MRHFLFLDVVRTSFPVVAVENHPWRCWLKQAKLEGFLVFQWPLCSDVEKAGSGSSCQHCCAGWICVPEQDGFSSEQNANAHVQGNYPQGIAVPLTQWVDCLQQNYFTCYQHRPAQLPVLAWMINEHHNWRTVENMNDGIVYLKAGLLIP